MEKKNNSSGTNEQDGKVTDQGGGVNRRGRGRGSGNTGRRRHPYLPNDAEQGRGNDADDQSDVLQGRDNADWSRGRNRWDARGDSNAVTLRHPSIMPQMTQTTLFDEQTEQGLGCRTAVPSDSHRDNLLTVQHERNTTTITFAGGSSEAIKQAAAMMERIDTKNASWVVHLYKTDIAALNRAASQKEVRVEKSRLSTSFIPALRPGKPLVIRGSRVEELPDGYLDENEDSAEVSGQENTGKQVVVASKAASTTAPVDTVMAGICPECGKPGHTLQQCIWPERAGHVINGCTICNDNMHLVDRCPQWASMTKAQKFKVLVTDRANMPGLELSEGTWANVAWDLELKAAFQKYPNASIPMPWSPSFTRKVIGNRGILPKEMAYMKPLIQSAKKYEESLDAEHLPQDKGTLVLKNFVQTFRLQTVAKSTSK
ncbi:hypothetical protein HJFPF1_02647 [Paramyrothecium foliicola]|nr:hypothetical protein HJFPF1_02647 [Paramyrothecium foliicola]